MDDVSPQFSGQFLIDFPIPSSKVSPGCLDDDDVAIIQAGEAIPWRPGCQEVEVEGWRLASGQRCVRRTDLTQRKGATSWRPRCQEEQGSRWFHRRLAEDDDEDGEGGDEDRVGDDDEDDSDNNEVSTSIAKSNQWATRKSEAQAHRNRGNRCEQRGTQEVRGKQRKQRESKAARARGKECEQRESKAGRGKECEQRDSKDSSKDVLEQYSWNANREDLTKTGSSNLWAPKTGVSNPWAPKTGASNPWAPKTAVSNPRAPKTGANLVRGGDTDILPANLGRGGNTDILPANSGRGGEKCEQRGSEDGRGKECEQRAQIQATANQERQSAEFRVQERQISEFRVQGRQSYKHEQPIQRQSEAQRCRNASKEAKGCEQRESKGARGKECDQRGTKEARGAECEQRDWSARSWKSPQPADGAMSIGTWNVEGLGDIDESGSAKLFEVQRHMLTYDMGVLCMQETQRPGTAEIETPEGYHVLLSGAPCEARERAGVGFVVAPWLWKHVKSYKMISSQLAVLKVRIRGGVMAIITAYAPTGTHDYKERKSFHHCLAATVERTSAHGPILVFGDMNARIHRMQPNERDIVGPGVFGHPTAEIKADSNRYLLMELCHRTSMCLANTLRPGQPEHLATYYDLGTKPLDPVVYPAFAQLDYVVVPVCWAHCIVSTVVQRFARRTISCYKPL